MFNLYFIIIIIQPCDQLIEPYLQVLLASSLPIQQTNVTDYIRDVREKIKTNDKVCRVEMKDIQQSEQLLCSMKYQGEYFKKIFHKSSDKISGNNNKFDLTKKKLFYDFRAKTTSANFDNNQTIIGTRQ